MQYKEALTPEQIKHWRVCIGIMNKPEYIHLHKLYSDIEGWAKLSFKNKQIKVDYTMEAEIIESSIKRLLNMGI